MKVCSFEMFLNNANYLFTFTEERINKLEKELENANDLLAAARQRGNKNMRTTINLFLILLCPSEGVVQRYSLDM